uniref:Glycoprotein n=1 Tax=Strongyloides venezuelensis TaxID=75913 RepID=A0A0K0G0V0_STRVS
MKTISYIVLLSILLAPSVYSLIVCPYFIKIEEFIPFPPMSVICDLIGQENYAEYYVYYIKANFTTETCTYSPLTRAFISPKVIIAVDNKTIYRRGPESHTIRPPCLPTRAEYLTGDVYLLIQSIPHPTGDMFKLEDSFKNAACSNFLDEAANISSGSSTYEEKLKFIRRVTASDGIIGDIQDGRIYYASCGIINQPVVGKEIIECDCFYGALVKTSDGKGWYSKNGLDVIGKAKVDECIRHTNSPLTIKQSIGFISSSGGTYDNENFFPKILSSLWPVRILIILSFAIIFMYCFFDSTKNLKFSSNREYSQGNRNTGGHVSHA